MKKVEMTCINCPIGCFLTVEQEDGSSEWKVSGNTCKRGATYAIAEMTHPVRTLTSTVKVANRPGKYLAVKTAAPISKEKMFEAMALLRNVSVEAPVKIGTVIVPGLLGEADLIASGEIL